MPAKLRMSWVEKRAHFAAKESEHNRRRRHAVSDARRRGTHTEAEWQAMKRACDFACVACGAEASPTMRLQRDHIIPVAAYGCECISNIQPMCWRCNATKGARAWGDMRPANWRDLMENAP